MFVKKSNVAVLMAIIAGTIWLSLLTFRKPPTVERVIVKEVQPPEVKPGPDKDWAWTYQVTVNRFERVTECCYGARTRLSLQELSLGYTYLLLLCGDTPAVNEGSVVEISYKVTPRNDGSGCHELGVMRIVRSAELKPTIVIDGKKYVPQ